MRGDRLIGEALVGTFPSEAAIHPPDLTRFLVSRSQTIDAMAEATRWADVKDVRGNIVVEVRDGAADASPAPAIVSSWVEGRGGVERARD